jgi:L-ascorbate metabolism protein UlaG (beta-lactamase superfamily)
MDITWIGHSCFRLKGPKSTVITDPFPPTLGLPLGDLEASLITISNTHPNHNNRAGINGSPIVLDGPGEYDVSHVYIKGIQTHSIGAPNTAFLIDIDGLTICHLGDLAEPLSAKHKESLGIIHVLLLPVGGGCTLPVPQLLDSIRLLEPRVVIPMHYLTEGINVELGPLEAFLKETGMKNVQAKPELSITPSTLPHDRSVIVLKQG